VVDAILVERVELLFRDLLTFLELVVELPEFDFFDGFNPEVARYSFELLKLIYHILTGGLGG